MNRVLFLDRDGVINEDRDYVHKIDDFVFKDGIFELTQELQKRFKIVVITNQSGIGRGYYSKSQFLELDRYMRDAFLKRGVFIEETLYCPHKPEDECECRKPKSGLIDEYSKRVDLLFEESIFIGDKLSDMECAKRAKIGCRLFLLGKESENLEMLDCDVIIAKNLQVAKELLVDFYKEFL